jgi:hypothetical protein
MHPDKDFEIEIDSLPELNTIVLMTGSMMQAEVGGQVCTQTGILIITSA